MTNKIIKRLMLLAALIIAPVFCSLAQNEAVRTADLYGRGMIVAGLCLIILALLMLIVVFVYTRKILHTSPNTVLRKKTEQKPAPTTTTEKKDPEAGGEEFAAIAAAIYLYNNERHRAENIILTIEKTTRPWTPWNAKYYSMNDYFMRKNR